MDVSLTRELEPRHLLALDAVAEEGTFGAAANRLGYTQSAVSQQIAALERLVGGRVFDRPGGPRPVELTALGQLVLDRGRDIVRRVDALDDELDRFRRGDAGLLRLGTFQSVSSAVLPIVVGRLRADTPGLEIRVHESDIDDELDGMLRDGEIDMSFVVGDDRPDFEHRHLLDDPFVLLAPPGSYPPGPVSIDEFGGEPMVGQHANSCQALNEAGLRAAGCIPTYVYRTNDNGTVAAMVRAGLGVAVLPLLCVEPADPRVSLHHIDPPIPRRRISLAWRADRTLPPSAELLVDVAVEVCAELDRALDLAL